MSYRPQSRPLSATSFAPTRRSVLQGALLASAAIGLGPLAACSSGGTGASSKTVTFGSNFSNAVPKKAMDEVSGPVIGIALILSAVFIPVAFVPGLTGRLYQQFALTIAISVLISAFNALSLSPALSAMLLKPIPKDHILARKSVDLEGLQKTAALHHLDLIKIVLNS